MIHNLKDMIRRYCDYGMKYRENDGNTPDWVSLLPELEFSYNISKHSLRKKTPVELESSSSPFFPKDALLNKNIVIHPTTNIFYVMMQQAERYGRICIEEAVDYNKSRWYKSHRSPELKVGDLVSVSAVNFNNILGSRKLKDSFSGTFVIKELHGKNAVEVFLTGDLAKKTP